jgi:trimeric autotransporter adhesin
MLNPKEILAVIALSLTMGNAHCDTNLVASYPFDGNANDISGNGNNGSVSGAVLTTDRFGNQNSAFQFNGSSAAVLVSDNAALQTLSSNFTFLIWAKFASLPNRDMALLLKSIGAGTQNNKWTLWRHVNAPLGIGVLAAAPERNWNFNYAFVTNRWYFIGFSAKGTNASISVDGVTLSVQTVNTTLNSTTGANLSIGGAEPGGNQWFHGDLDEVRIYNRSLSSTEIAQIHTVESRRNLTVRKAVYLETGTLGVGTNYQVQVSSALVDWTNFGNAFIATNAFWRSTNYWDVDNWDSLFFRILPVP